MDINPIPVKKSNGKKERTPKDLVRKKNSNKKTLDKNNIKNNPQKMTMKIDPDRDEITENSSNKNPVVKSNLKNTVKNNDQKIKIKVKKEKDMKNNTKENNPNKSNSKKSNTRKNKVKKKDLSKKNEGYSCKFCEKTFFRYTSYHVHNIIHTKCAQYFNNKGNVKRHSKARKVERYIDYKKMGLLLFGYRNIQSYRTRAGRKFFKVKEEEHSPSCVGGYTSSTRVTRSVVEKSKVIEEAASSEKIEPLATNPNSSGGETNDGSPSKVNRLALQNLKRASSDGLNLCLTQTLTKEEVPIKRLKMEGPRKGGKRLACFKCNKTYSNKTFLENHQTKFHRTVVS